MNDFIKCILIFLMMMIVDYIWGHYIKNLNDGKALKAAIFSSLIISIGSFSTINYVENHYFIIPAITGGFIGTFYAAKHNKK